MDVEWVMCVWAVCTLWTPHLQHEHRLVQLLDDDVGPIVLSCLMFAWLAPGFSASGRRCAPTAYLLCHLLQTVWPTFPRRLGPSVIPPAQRPCSI